jgi:putative transposase
MPRGKNYTPEFKARVLVEALKEESSLSEIAAKYNLNTNMVRNWRKQFLDHPERVFEQSRVEKESQKKDQEHEQEVDELHRIIGEITVERDYLQRRIRESFGRTDSRKDR